MSRKAKSVPSKIMEYVTTAPLEEVGLTLDFAMAVYRKRIKDKILTPLEPKLKKRPLVSEASRAIEEEDIVC